MGAAAMLVHTQRGVEPFSVDTTPADLLYDHALELLRQCNEGLLPTWDHVSRSRYALLAAGWKYNRGARTMEELMEYRALQERNYREALASHLANMPSELWKLDEVYHECERHFKALRDEICETVRNLGQLRGKFIEWSEEFDIERGHTTAIICHL